MLDIRLLGGIKDSGQVSLLGHSVILAEHRGPLYLFQLPHVAQFL